MTRRAPLYALYGLIALQGILIALHSPDALRAADSADAKATVKPGVLMKRIESRYSSALDRGLPPRTGQIVAIYDRWFGKLGKPSPLLTAMFAINGIPE